jgi:hypothetical protein
VTYEAILSGQTNSKEQLCENGILIGSVPFFEEEEEKTKLNEKINKFNCALDRLKTAVKNLDLLPADFLARHNFEISGQTPENATVNALELGNQWMIRYNVKAHLKEGRFKNCLSWEKNIVNSETYLKIAETVKSFYDNNTNGFQQKVAKVVGERISFLSTKLVIDPIKAAEKCIEYTLEECVAVLIIRYTGKYDALIYIQGKLNEPTHDMATNKFEIDDESFLIINKKKLNLITVARYESLTSTAKLTIKPSLTDVRYLMFPPTKNTKASRNDNNSKDHPGHSDREIALKAFFDSPVISSTEKKEFLVELLRFSNNNDLQLEEAKEIDQRVSPPHFDG